MTTAAPRNPHHRGPLSGGRSGKQCRERWHNHLDPRVKKGDWTADEDQLIINMQAKLGNQWAKITRMLPGRTDNAARFALRSLRARARGPAACSPRL